MANTVIHYRHLVRGLTGLKLELRSSAVSADPLNTGGDTLTESVQGGLYTATVTEAITGRCWFTIKTSAGNVIDEGWSSLLADTVGPYELRETPQEDENGNGPYNITIPWTYSGGTALVGAQVWINTSSTNSSPRLYEAITDGSGNAKFQLAAGTYYVRMRATGYRSNSVYTLVVTGEETFTLS